MTFCLEVQNMTSDYTEYTVISNIEPVRGGGSLIYCIGVGQDTNGKAFWPFYINNQSLIMRTESRHPTDAAQGGVNGHEWIRGTLVYFT